MSLHAVQRTVIQLSQATDTMESGRQKIKREMAVKITECKKIMLSENSRFLKNYKPTKGIIKLKLQENKEYLIQPYHNCGKTEMY